MFSSQSKHKVFLKSLGTAIANAVYEELSNRPNLTSSLIEIIIGNHRARMAGEQARNIKSLVNVKKKWTTPDSFLPCASIKTEQPKEIFLVEGNSAGGGLNGARDARYQAVLFSKGKPSNVYDSEDATKVFASDSWKNVVPTLGCGVGDSFDIKKLKYDIIVICTDADIDGFHIRVLFLTFFMKYLPQLIEAGKLYIAEPPLYKLVSGKNVQYVATQTEYIQACIKSISDLKVQFSEKSVKCSIQDFVTEAFNYLDTLIECSINRSVNRYLLEYIAFGIAQYQTIDNFIKHIDKWLINVTTNFKEIGYDHKTNQVYAVIDLIDNFVLIDNELMVELADVIRIIQKYGLIIHYSSNKRNIDRSEELSKFFEFIESVYPKIKGRYKGLGSSDPDVLREVVMDPRTRRIYQVTIEDVMTWEHMASIAGGSREDINKRKEILMNFKFTKADIDN
jgi:DNA gyrase subunit B